MFNFSKFIPFTKVIFNQKHCMIQQISYNKRLYFSSSGGSGISKIHGGSGDAKSRGGSGDAKSHGGSGDAKIHGGSGDAKSHGGSGDAKSYGANFSHNYHKECEDGLNKQINLELQASYTYYCMWACLSRPEVALPGYAKFFAGAAAEERDHADKLITFVMKRGGTVLLAELPAPGGPFHDPAEALRQSIELEKKLLVELEKLHKTANDLGDCFLVDFLESNFIGEGYLGIAQLAEMLHKVERAGPGVGVTLLDLDLLRHPPNMHGG